eukprot:TRINITY_DN6626_c0_g1_i3.p1 TRINITY_DN6626_c0_g1~~TRINITY_DN6626_c0_g1_i3.p1  ORF type:complete len:283 (-),score=59.58 TRINITY_DN6626_c0_g1_i3:314-1162(-)
MACSGQTWTRHCASRAMSSRAHVLAPWPSSSATDFVFARELLSVLARQFPERLEGIFVINNHWTMTFFGTAIMGLLDPCVRQRIVLCGTDFLPWTKEKLPEDHPYLLYAKRKQELDPSEAALLPLPPRTAQPPEPRPDALKPDAPGGDEDDQWPSLVPRSPATSTHAFSSFESLSSFASVQGEGDVEEWGCDCDSDSDNLRIANLHLSTPMSKQTTAAPDDEYAGPDTSPHFYLPFRPEKKNEKELRPEAGPSSWLSSLQSALGCCALRQDQDPGCCASWAR